MDKRPWKKWIVSEVVLKRIVLVMNCTSNVNQEVAYQSPRYVTGKNVSLKIKYKLSVEDLGKPNPFRFHTALNEIGQMMACSNI